MHNVSEELYIEDFIRVKQNLSNKSNKTWRKSGNNKVSDSTWIQSNVRHKQNNLQLIDVLQIAPSQIHKLYNILESIQINTVTLGKKDVLFICIKYFVPNYFSLEWIIMSGINMICCLSFGISICPIYFRRKLES